MGKFSFEQPSTSLQKLVRSGIFAIAYFLSVKASLYFVIQPQGLAVIWPASGVALAIMLLSGQSERLRNLTIIFIMNAIANFTSGNTLPVSFGFAFANTLEPMLGSWIFTRYLTGKITLTSFKEAVILLLAATLGNGLTGLIGAAVPVLAFGSNYWNVWSVWLIADGLGIILITPLIITLIQGNRPSTPVQPRRIAECAFIMSLFIVLCLFIFVFQKSENIILRSYMILPFLIWPAFRFPLMVSEILFLLLFLIAVGGTTTGLGIFSFPGQLLSEEILHVQIFIGIVVSTMTIINLVVADRKKAMTLLQESEHLSKEVQRLTKSGIWEYIVETGKINWTEEVYRIYGVSPEDYDPNNIDQDMEFYTPEDRAIIEHAFHKAVKEGQTYDLELKFKNAQGEALWVRTTGQAEMRDGKVMRIFGNIMDITERRKAEEALQNSEERFRMIFERGQFGITIATPNFKFITANPAFCQMTRYTAEELSNLTFIDITPQDRANIDRENIDKMTRGEINQYKTEKQYIRKDGQLFWGNLITTPIHNKEGKIIFYIAMIEDITERKKAEEKIQQSLLEKETLLKEIHHRVKNNMQVISSMLSLQSGKIKDDTLKKMFNESQNRVKSMAMVHDMLYKAKDLASINSADYIKDLIKDLIWAVSGRQDNLKTIINADNIMLDLDTAVPLGLIVNELVTNVLKYAFPNQRSGELTVSLTKADDLLTLSVKDNGTGLPEGFDYTKTGTIGLQLVTVLTRQIGGTFRMSSANGTEAVVTFKQKGDYDEKKDTYS